MRMALFFGCFNGWLFIFRYPHCPSSGWFHPPPRTLPAVPLAILGGARPLLKLPAIPVTIPMGCLLFSVVMSHGNFSGWLPAFAAISYSYGDPHVDSHGHSRGGFQWGSVAVAVALFLILMEHIGCLSTLVRFLICGISFAQ